MAYPENYGENREPVQVIATTHSPYLLDLYKDHPEEIVIAHKQGADATFERLSDRADINEILQEKGADYRISGLEVEMGIPPKVVFVIEKQ